MKKLLLILFVLLVIFTGACAKKIPEGFIFVEGGDFVNTKSNLYGKGLTISDFYISRFEVTQKEWAQIMVSNPSEFEGDDLPVEMVSWYDCVEYCNKRSIKEGLKPYYNINKDRKDPKNHNDNDDMKWTVTINPKSKGYRLPTEAEWEYAAGGGQESRSYEYSGSDKADEVAWYWRNSGDEYLDGEWFWQTIEANHNRTRTIGSKLPNELGIYDMSGNVREWCWDWFSDVVDSDSGTVRVWRGGGWLGDAKACETTYRGSFEANCKGFDQGFRLCLSK